MSRMLNVILPVSDLPRSVAFFTALGFATDPQFAGDDAGCLLLSERACITLVQRSFFARLTSTTVAEPGGGAAAILAVTAGSRAEVDHLVDRALAYGGSRAGRPADSGYLYARSFLDLDGQVWEVSWSDTSAVG